MCLFSGSSRIRRPVAAKIAFASAGAAGGVPGPLGGDHDRTVAILRRDRARSNVGKISELCLVEMTRKRTRESLQHILCGDCPSCEGRGFILTVETVCFEIFREIIRQARQFEFDEVLVLAHQEVIELLLDEQAQSLAVLGEQTGKSIRLQTESLYQQDQFDVVLM